MAYLCEECGGLFRGDSAEEKYKEHMDNHYRGDNNCIKENPCVREFYVLAPSIHDCTRIVLQNIQTGLCHYGDALMQFHNTDIKISHVEHMIGKKIRITTRTEFID